MKVLVIGGTGFIGYYSVLELLRHGHTVTVAARNLPKLPNLFPAEVVVKQLDIEQDSEEKIEAVLAGHEGVVFAAGRDEQSGAPLAPAYQYFFKGNVFATERVFRLANQVGVKHGVVCGSYFTYFDRLWPDKKLAKHHPYIWSRKEQSRIALQAGTNMLVAVLELPYIFGSMPGRKPLWTPLIKYVDSKAPLFYTTGGTAMVSVQHVAEAVVGALENVAVSGSFPVSDVNMSWEEMFSHFSRIMNKAPKRVIALPYKLTLLVAYLAKFRTAIQGREQGLDLTKFLALQSSNTFIAESDLEQARSVLKFGIGGIVEAFADTIKSAQKEKI
jgi:nucleoside-diphosphate-sugar epimerase